MNTQTIHATLRLAHGPGASWDVCRVLLARAQADGQDVFAVLHPAHYLTYRLRQETEDGKFFHHTPVDVTPELATPISAAAQDIDIVPVQQTWPVVVQARPRKHQRLDTQYAHRHTPGMLIIGDTADPAAILTGASRLLAKNQVTVLLDLTVMQPAARAAALERCAALLPSHYWTDSLLLPLTSPACRAALLNSLHETIFCALPVPPNWFDSAESLIGALSLQNWNLPVQPAPWHRTEFNIAELILNEFHRLETDGSTSWAWSGPGARATVYVPVPGPGFWILHFKIFNWGQNHIQDLSFYANEKSAVVETVSDPIVTLAPFAHPGGYVRVDIVTARRMRASRDDARLIGVCVSSCTLEKSKKVLLQQPSPPRKPFPPSSGVRGG